MTDLERLIVRQRAKLLRVDRKGQADIVRTHQVVTARLNRRLAELTKRITEARRAGDEVRPGWLFAQERYRTLIGEMETYTLRFLQQSLATVVGQKTLAIEQAQVDAPVITAAYLGPAPRDAIAEVKGTFTRLPEGVIDRIVVNAGDDAPLGRLFASIAPQAVEKVRDELAFGVAAGRPVREIAREVRKQIGVPMSRALTISRTEVIRAYRESTTEQYRDSRVVRGWSWWANLDTRTCSLCWAMHGTEHDVSEDQDSHPCCRCTQLPLTRSWAELGFRSVPDGRPAVATGEQRFATLSAEDKLAILGRSRLDAYNAGLITLEDLVRPTASSRWGRGIRQANLAELGVSAAP